MVQKFKKGDEVKYTGPVQSIYGKKKYIVLKSIIGEDGRELTSVREIGSPELGPTNNANDYEKVSI